MTDVSDEGIDNVIEALIDLLLPKSTRTIRGNGWVLTREDDNA